ncbi:hypothetical protein CHARACLAT_014756 [Characodon lateralis]|uniref:Uncharacterized protein n=1 Tax=Characodon lateralis TaxID=208331 RepID=A0ABU7EJ67_9TELE|nr:hypothetical protein [Characodon lateralis]
MQLILWHSVERNSYCLRVLNKVIAASLHKNVQSSGMRWGQAAEETVSLGAKSSQSPVTEGWSFGGVLNLMRQAKQTAFSLFTYPLQGLLHLSSLTFDQLLHNYHFP